MMGQSSTAQRGWGHGHGHFFCPDGGDVEEDRGSGSGDGKDGTPDDRGSGEECNNRSALPAMVVNPLDSMKRAYRHRREGGGGGTTRW